MKYAQRFAKLGLLLVALGVAAYIASGHEPPLSARADAAYQAGDFPKALDLYKQYAKTKDVYTNPDLRSRVTMMIVNLQQKLSPSAASAPAMTHPSMAATTTQDDSSLEAALAFTMGKHTVIYDPTTGKERVPHPAPKAGDFLSMTIPQLGNFEFDPNVDDKVPEDVQALNGMHIKLTGFMIPLTQAEKIESFALVPTLGACCYGAPPGVQHIVTCHLPKGHGSDFYIDEIEVEGTLKVAVKRDSGFTNSVFELAATAVTTRD